MPGTVAAPRAMRTFVLECWGRAGGRTMTKAQVDAAGDALRVVLIAVVGTTAKSPSSAPLLRCAAVRVRRVEPGVDVAHMRSPYM